MVRLPQRVLDGELAKDRTPHILAYGVDPLVRPEKPLIEPVQPLDDLLGVVPLEQQVAEFALDNLFAETSFMPAMACGRSFRSRGWPAASLPRPLPPPCAERSAKVSTIASSAGASQRLP